MSKLNRKELKHPDALQEKVISSIRSISKYTKQLITTGIIVLSILMIIVSYKFINSHKLKQDRSLYYKTVHKLDFSDTKTLENKFKTLIPKLKTREIKCFVTYKLADSLYKNAKYKEAKTRYEDILNHGRGILKELARFGLAKTEQKLKHNEEAEKLYKEIIKDKFHVYRALSMLSLAELYMEAGKKQLAIASLENLIISYKNTEYEKLAHLYKEELSK